MEPCPRVTQNPLRPLHEDWGSVSEWIFQRLLHSMCLCDHAPRGLCWHSVCACGQGGVFTFPSALFPPPFSMCEKVGFSFYSFGFFVFCYIYIHVSNQTLAIYHQEDQFFLSRGKIKKSIPSPLKETAFISTLFPRGPGCSPVTPPMAFPAGVCGVAWGGEGMGVRTKPNPDRQKAFF